MSTFKDILERIRTLSLTEHDKGERFEKLMRSWMLTDPRYNNLEKVWMWCDFPYKDQFGGKDTGIDLVTKTDMGTYWAIQCKCYSQETTIDKPAVDSFLATSSRTFETEQGTKTSFAYRLWISTTEKWGPNARESFQNQNPPVHCVDLTELENSSVDWDKLYDGTAGKNALQPPKTSFPHQEEAVQKALAHYKDSDRGKLIMACGTGKTFTALKIVETLLGGKGLVLFMVPSIALLNQALNAWATDSLRDIKAICICSDNKASKRNQQEEDSLESIVDLALPASTSAQSVCRQLKAYQDYEGLVVVFSTYQSIDAVAEAQAEILQETQGAYGEFDFIVCDEAHRTTGVKSSRTSEKNFTKIHSNENVRGKKRLYMTATPRIYGQGAKIKARDKDCILCSMDDVKLYGKEFYRVNFSYAVQKGLLTDYKVLVLTVNEKDIPRELQKQIRDENLTELNYDDTSKLVGVINGLSKMLQGDGGKTWNADPRMMRRAVAFCSAIGDTHSPGTSKNIEYIFPEISKAYSDQLAHQEKSHRAVHVATSHIDGSMNAQERNKIISWLKEEPADPLECRVVSNVRCLSEGVDVPALDAVIFLSSRSSHVDVVQSVGRVMRNFRKGQPDEKKFGYIIIPIVVPPGVSPEEALSDNERFAVVWDILNALRSHDDHFNAIVNQIALNYDKTSKVIVAAPGFAIGQSTLGGSQDQADAVNLQNSDVAQQLNLQFGPLQEGIYARLVEHCGERRYWENWGKSVGEIAKKLIARIQRFIFEEGLYREEFDHFVEDLQRNLNPSVDAAQAIEMLAQHVITHPVFDALFEEYQFIKNNAVSRSMETMIELLNHAGLRKDTQELDKFYDSVKVNVGHIDNLEGKQKIIKDLYEQFFKGAFPLTVEKLGIVYTPIECVDFILHSVEAVLQKEFQLSLSDEDVHILDPFVGTGTFITRLLQSGLIRPNDIERKYRNEIHCNELVLLAYYIADVNIESVFHEVTHRQEYLPYNGICLTDTFQLNENGAAGTLSQRFQGNCERLLLQQRAPVRVIIGNPPYSVGQKSANDNAQNSTYPHLKERIVNTYVKQSTTKSKKALHDSYIRAFRWASDRLGDQGGVIAFISNGVWIDATGHDGFRKGLEEEFFRIYVVNMRGDCNASGEMRKKEKGGIFGSGSKTPISITLLVKKKGHPGKATISYHDIGDYLTREDKLQKLQNFQSIASPDIDWVEIHPNDKQDWINLRGNFFDTLLPLAPKKKFDSLTKSFFTTYSLGIGTNRDGWVYNFSKQELRQNTKRMVEFYNSQVEELIQSRAVNNKITTKEFADRDPHKIDWSSSLEGHLDREEKAEYQPEKIFYSIYRPFENQFLYMGDKLIHRRGKQEEFFPSSKHKNQVICVSGVGSKKNFSTLICNYIPCLDLLEKTQCFPLYWYEEGEEAEPMEPMLLAQEKKEPYTRRDGISDWILNEARNCYGAGKEITKEHLFYYVYGLLHSPDYRETFANDLRKGLPRIPLVKRLEDFLSFYKVGKELAELHLHYETLEPCPGVQVIETLKQGDENEYYRVQKMRFPKKGETQTILYNDRIRIEQIPSEAYQYIVNGKSAIEWMMERYQDTVDKASQIRNDPNDWSREHQKPRYILDLLLSVIHLSLKTVDLVKKLPPLTFEGAGH